MGGSMSPKFMLTSTWFLSWATWALLLNIFGFNLWIWDWHWPRHTKTYSLKPASDLCVCAHVLLCFWCIHGASLVSCAANHKKTVSFPPKRAGLPKRPLDLRHIQYCKCNVEPKFPVSKQPSASRKGSKLQIRKGGRLNAQNDQWSRVQDPSLNTLYWSLNRISHHGLW